jgi:phosphomannomutase/phosphoglucomutase
MSPACDDEKKYDVVARIVKVFEDKKAADEQVAGRAIVDINTVNGVRFSLADGAWGLVRASSNTPNLVVVIESPNSKEDVAAIFAEIEDVLAKFPEVGAFDQKL